MNSVDVDSGVIRDKSGNENHATYSAIPNFPAISGDSFGFDGDEIVDYRPFNSLIPSEGFSAGAFAYVSDSQPRTSALLLHNGSFSNLIGWAIQVRENGSTTFTVGDGSSFDGQGSSAGIPVNKFVHIFGTYEPSTSTTKIYIDGELQSEDNVNEVPATRDEFSIGCRASFRTRYFRGRVSDVRIYNRVLSADEVNSLYNIRSSRSYGSPYVPQRPVAAGDLVAWYPFEAGDGVDATAFQTWAADDTDYSAIVNGPAYQETGGVTDIRRGVNSGAFEFDGTDDSILLSNNTVSGLTEITMLCWVNIQQPPTKFDGIFHNKGGTSINQDIGIMIEGNNTYHVEMTTDAGVNVDPSGGSIKINQWELVALTWSGKTNNFKFYVNGKSRVQTSLAGNTVASPNFSGTALGKRTDTDDYFGGLIDNARIYNVALSQNQINQIYLNTQP